MNRAILLAAFAHACSACTSAPASPPAEPTPVATTAPEAPPKEAPPKEASTTAPKTVATATMQPDGTIVMDMFQPHARITYTKGDAQYAEVLAHIGGMAPGETKAVPAWPDSFDEAKVTDAVVAWVAKNKGWTTRADLRIEIMGTGSDGSVVVSVGHASDHVSLTVDGTTYAVR